VIDARLSVFLPVRYRIKQGKFLKEHDFCYQETFLPLSSNRRHG